MKESAAYPRLFGSRVAELHIQWAELWLSGGLCIQSKSICSSRAGAKHVGSHTLHLNNLSRLKFIGGDLEI